jgi:hypothetical protein
MEGLDDYCNHSVNMGSSMSSSSPSAAAAPEEASESGLHAPAVRVERTLTFDRFPSVLGLHLNRCKKAPYTIRFNFD